MKQWISKLLVAGLLVLGLNTTSQGIEVSLENSSGDISLETKQSINGMSKTISFSTLSGSGEVSRPVTLNQEDDLHPSDKSTISKSAINSITNQMKTTQNNSPVKTVDKKAADYVPEVTNDCGFYCGRTQFCYYNYHRTSEKKDGPYWNFHPRDECAHCCNVTCNSCYTGVGLLDVAGLLSGIFWPHCASKELCCVCTLTTCSVSIAAAGTTALCVGYPIIGHTPYWCSLCTGHQEFSDSFERGLMCLPEDACSFTSLWNGFSNFWDPCCGKRTKES